MYFVDRNKVLFFYVADWASRALSEGMIETDDITVDQAQNFIRMEDLLAAMDGGALDMQNQLCYCCSFIIQCKLVE